MWTYYYETFYWGNHRSVSSHYVNCTCSYCYWPTTCMPNFDYLKWIWPCDLLGHYDIDTVSQTTCDIYLMESILWETLQMLPHILWVLPKVNGTDKQHVCLNCVSLLVFIEITIYSLCGWLIFNIVKNSSKKFISHF